MKKISKYLVLPLTFTIISSLTFTQTTFAETQSTTVAHNGGGSWVQDQIKYYGQSKGHGGQNQIKYHSKQVCHYYYVSKYICKGVGNCYWKHGKKYCYPGCYWKHGTKYCKKYGCGWYPVKYYKCQVPKYQHVPKYHY